MCFGVCQPVQMGVGLVQHLSASFGDVRTVVEDSWPVRVYLRLLWWLSLPVGQFG